MNLSTFQAAIIAAISQIAALLVSFAIINSTEAGVITSASMAIVNAAFVVGNAIENHGKSKTPPAK
jgi:hypothetical protein